MRLIKGKILLEMKSPIRHVMQHIHKAVINIAPERVREFIKAYPDLIIEYLDEDKWISKVDLEKNHVFLSRGVVEVLWCAAYAYMTIYKILSEKKKSGKKMAIVFHEDENADRATKMFEWVLIRWINKDDSPWPEKLPCPKKDPTQDSMEKLAEELSLCAVAYIIHHELSHIKLNHKANDDSIQSEKEADYEAADWILDHNFELNDLKFIKRALGIALALEVTTAYEIHTGKYGDSKHPRGYDRLINTLLRYIDDENHVVWATLTSMLKLHLDVVGIPTTSDPHKSFFDAVNYYVELLAQK